MNNDQQDDGSPNQSQQHRKNLLQLILDGKSGLWLTKLYKYSKKYVQVGRR